MRIALKGLFAILVVYGQVQAQHELHIVTRDGAYRGTLTLAGEYEMLVDTVLTDSIGYFSNTEVTIIPEDILTIVVLPDRSGGVWKGVRTGLGVALLTGLVVSWGAGEGDWTYGTREGWDVFKWVVLPLAAAGAIIGFLYDQSENEYNYQIDFNPERYRAILTELKEWEHWKWKEEN